MWNKFVKLLQDQSYQRLGIAVVVSAILHAFLFDGFVLSFPRFNDNSQPIQARIALNKVKPAPIEKQKKDTAMAKEPTVKPSQPDVPAKVEEIIEPPQTTEAPEQPRPESQHIADDVAAQQTNENLPLEEIPQALPNEPSLAVLNENAYQYVETEFDVHTEADGGVQGVAKITYHQVNNRYQLSWLTKGIGLTALFLPELLQHSEGEFTGKGLKPNKYSYQFGSDSSKTRQANFDWQSKKITSITSKGSNLEDLPEGAQDLLSFMYQFMHIEPLQQMEINIATGKKLATYNYSFEGEESVASKLGELRAIHIARYGNDADEKTDLWLAMDYQFIPVKIRKTEKNSKVIEMVVTRITTTRPEVEQ